MYLFVRNIHCGDTLYIAIEQLLLSEECQKMTGQLVQCVPIPSNCKVQTVYCCHITQYSSTVHI